MQAPKLESILHQTQIAAHISGRDARKRVGSGMLMVSVCQIAGFEGQGLLLDACAILYELVAYS
jgi:hypothetical protein